MHGRYEPRWSRSARACVALALGLTLVACGAGEEERAAVEPHPEAGGAAPAGEAPVPSTGRATVAFSGGRVTLRSRGAPRVNVILQLAESVGFDLEMSEIAPATLTLDIEDAEIERALPVLLHSLPYRAEYEFDPTLARHVLARLRVGAPVAPPAGDRGAEAGGEEAEGDLAGRAPLPDPARGAQVERGPGERLRLPESLDPAVVAELASSSPTRRVEAVSTLEPEGPGLEVLLDYLAADPDPQVRAAAAEQLGDSDAYSAVRGLVAALDDPDARVVLAAVEAIDMLWDESLAPELRPLLDHPDPEVRDWSEGRA
jgi:hypothetical protein